MGSLSRAGITSMVLAIIVSNGALLNRWYIVLALVIFIIGVLMFLEGYYQDER